MEKMTTDLLMKLYADAIVNAAETFYICSGEDYHDFMITLSRAKFSENSSYILAALLTMTEDDLGDACNEIIEILNRVSADNQKEQISNAVDAAKSVMEANMGNEDEKLLTPKEMAEYIKTNFSIKCSPQVINKILVKLGYQIKDSEVRYLPTGKAHSEKVYGYEMVNKHATLKWSIVIVPKLVGEM